MGMFIGVILIVAISWIFYLVVKAASNAFNQRLEKINRTSGFQFSSELFLGSVSHGFLFDTENKKICHVQGKAFKVLDYGYIRSWELSWDENLKNALIKYSNICFTFGTNDLARPVIKIKLYSKTSADEWRAKLAILFG